MLESATDSHASAILPYGLLITRNLMYYSINLFAYLIVEVSATYDSNIFSIMGYVLADNEWCKKKSAKASSDPPKISKYVSNLMFPMLKEFEEFKDQLKAIEEGLMVLQESNTRLLQLGIDVGKVYLTFDQLKQEGVKLFNRFFDRIESIMTQSNYSNNELAISV
ncbi:hypothetical protein FXO37_28926 [Capsicum annuum]|nr:hypothetical protein FXO37_28926 [Capsicum annuum]